MPTTDTVSNMPADSPEKEALQRATAHLTRMRDFRRPYDSKRVALFRQYLGQRDARNFPDGRTPRSNTFAMIPMSNVETIRSRTLDAFFSFDPWFECRGRGSMDDPAAEAMQLVLNYLLKRSNLIPAFEALVTNVLIYGHAALKVDWDWEYDTVQYAKPIPAIDPESGQPILDPMTGQPVVVGYEPATKQVPRMRPRFIPIDVFDLMLDPDGGFAAHLVERTFGQLKREAAAKPDYYRPEAIAQLEAKLKDEKNPDEIVLRLAELWNEIDGVCTMLVYGGDAEEALGWKNTRAAYRASGYSTYKRKAYTGETILLWHGPNQFAHKRSPILSTSYIKLPNEVYGIGAIEPIAEMTESLNRFLNMIADNWNLGINKRYAYDINRDIDHEALNNFNVPGGKVGVSGNPNDSIFPLPTHTPEPGDYTIIDLYKGLIEMTSGVSDFYAKGVGGSGSNDTATGISSIINESNFRFRMFIRNLEVDILQPLLQMCASMTQQFITDDLEIRITDAEPAIAKYPVVAPEQLLGTFDFDLVASNYATNKVVRQRQLLAFANWAAQTPFWNPYTGLLEMAKVMEIRNAQKLLLTPEQVAAQQQAQMQQQVQLMMLEKAMDVEGKARLAQAKPQPAGSKGKAGRPRGAQQEGKMPGAGLTSEIRDLAQGFGANALGLEGMGEVGSG